MNSQTAPRFWQLYGKLRGHPELWSVRVTRDFRAVGLLDGDTITWFWIGDHQTFAQTFAR